MIVPAAVAMAHPALTMPFARVLLAGAARTGTFAVMATLMALGALPGFRLGFRLGGFGLGVLRDGSGPGDKNGSGQRRQRDVAYGFHLDLLEGGAGTSRADIQLTAPQRWRSRVCYQM